jgi:hypothetical protein
MGLFSKKPIDKRTADDLAAIDLNQRLNFRPHNYYDVSMSFLSHAFPGSPMFSNRALIPTECSSIEVRNALERFVAGNLSADDLASLVFGTNTFAEFVDQIFSIKKTSCGGASVSLLEKLKAIKWSQEWESALDTQRVDAYVWDCLGDAGSRPATSSGLVHDGWRHKDAHAIHYAEAAKIGFVAIAEPFNLVTSSFGWKQDRQSQADLLAAVVISCPSQPNPLEVLSSRHRSAVEQRCEQISFRLTRMFGDHSGEAIMPYTFQADSFKNSIFSAAQHGAMLAAIGIDPSGCRVYSGYGESKRQLSPEELPWRS